MTLSLNSRVVTFVLLVLVSFVLKGETYRTQHWGVDNIATEGDEWDIIQGLPQISVRALSFDQNGLLWVGTEHGLARFDGHSFEIFNTTNTPQLASNWIDALHVSRDNRVWIATADGVVVRDRHQFNVINGFGSGTRVNAITQTSDDAIWMGGSALWQVLNGQIVNTIELESPVKYLAAHADSVIFSDLQNQLFTIHNNTLIKLNDTVDTHRNSTSAYLILNNTLYKASGNNLAQFHLSQDNDLVLQQQSQLSESIVALAANDSHIFALTKQGNILRNSNTLAESWLQLSLPSLVPVDTNTTTFMVSGEHLWFGNYTTGLRVYWPSIVTREESANLSSSAISSAKIWSFFADSYLYAASDSGVFKRDASGQWQHLVTPAQLDNRVAYSYLRDMQYEWVGTRGGLYVRDISGHTFSLVSELGQRQINTLVLHDNTLWVATSRGLFTITNNLSSVENNAEFSANSIAPMALTEISEFKNTPIRSVFHDREGHTWIGTEAALFVIKNTRVERITLPATGSVFVSGINQLPNGHIIVSSYGEGLFILQSNGQWRQLTKQNGLPFQSLFGMELDSEWIWLSSAEGVFRLRVVQLNDANITSHTLLRDDGRFVNRNRLRCCNGAGNRRTILFDESLYLPTLEGVLAIPDKPAIPKLNAVLVRSVLVAHRRLSWSDVIRLPGDKRDIDIAFTAPLYNSEDIVEYRYRMLPSQPDWTYTTQRQVAYFTNLPPGTSQFEVQARVVESDWIAVSPLIIEAEYRPLETWLAKLVGLLIICAAVWGIVQIRTRQLHSRAVELESLVAARTADYERVNQELLKTNQELSYAAITDTLTGLYNRRFVQQNLPRLVAFINRQHTLSSASCCAVIVMDIDHFKFINDSFGHDKGDEVLVATSKALQTITRETDYLVRWGGEEFVLVIPDITKQDLTNLYQRIHNCMQLVAQCVELDLPITLSIGAVCLPWSRNDATNKTWERSLTLADHALYKAKGNGRHCTAIAIIQQSMDELAEWDYESLEQAINDGYWQIQIKKPL